MKNKTPYPKSWKKTPEQIGNIWTLIDGAARGIAMNPKNLSALKQYSDIIGKLVKKIERAQVADAIDSAK